MILTTKEHLTQEVRVNIIKDLWLHRRVMAIIG